MYYTLWFDVNSIDIEYKVEWPDPWSPSIPFYRATDYATHMGFWLRNWMVLPC